MADAELAIAVKKMEEKAGSLPDEVVAELVAFFKSPNAIERVAVEQERVAAQFAAKIDPADATIGATLFFGRRALANGGLSRVACHAVDGVGGNLGSDLAGIYEKTGGSLPLISAIEQSKFAVMEPHYRRRPMTKQEAAHLAEYISTIIRTPNAKLQGMPKFALVGDGVGVALLAGMFDLLKH